MKHFEWVSRLKSSMLPIWVLCLGTIVAFLYAWDLHNRQAEEQAHRLNLLETAVVEHLQEHLRRYDLGLRGLRGAIAAGRGIDRQGFLRFIESRDLEAEFPGLGGFAFVRRVSSDKDAELLAEMKRDGINVQAFRYFQPHDGDRFVVQHIAPEAKNAAAFGLDIGSEPNRHETIWAAIRDGDVRISRPIQLVQSEKPNIQGFLMMLPVYSTGYTPDTETKRKDSAVGIVNAPLAIDQVLAEFDFQGNSFYLRLFDVGDKGEASLFFTSPNSSDSDSVGVSREIDVPIYGRVWRIEIVALPNFVRNLNFSHPLNALGQLFFVTLLLAGLTQLYLIHVRHKKESELNEAMASLAAIVAGANDAIIGLSLNGRVTSWNRAAVEMFGYSECEAIGQPLAVLIVPDELRQASEQLFAKLIQEHQIKNFETRRHHKDGRQIDVSVSWSRVLDGQGVLIGTSLDIRDISAEKLAQQRVLALNAEQEAAQAQRQAMLDRILENASIGIALIKNRELIFSNHRMAEIFAYSLDALEHFPTRRLYRDEESYERVGLEGYEALSRGERYSIELPMQDSRNNEIWIRLYGSAINPEDPDAGSIWLFEDISVQKAIEFELLSERIQMTQRNEEIARRDQQFRLLFQTIPIPMVFFARGVIQYSNEQFGSIFGFKDDSKLTIEQLWNQAGLDPELLEMVKARSLSGQEQVVDGDGRLPEREYKITTCVGDKRDMLVGGHCFGNGWLITFIDITQLKQTEAALMLAKIQAEEATLAKSIFLANMSHEIRTPMNAILGVTHLLRKESLTKTQSSKLALIANAGDHLLSLINDILDISKIEAGRVELEDVDFDLNEMLGRIASIMTLQIRAKGLELVIDVEGIPSRLRGDSTRLSQALINYLGNAVKFTHSGAIVLRGRVEEETAEDILIRFEVRDSGIGLEPEQIARMFTPFVQASASTNREFGGTGLGLAITRHIAELMDGAVGVESAPGVGSTFWITARLRKEGAADAAHQASDNPLRGLRVLVVDDLPIALQVHTQLANKLGMQATAVEHVHAVLEQLLAADQAGRPFDILLADFHMPELDGFQLLEELKRLPLSKPPTPILVTAYGDIRVIESAQSAGFADVIGKPLGLKGLEESLLASLALAKSETPDACEPPEVQIQGDYAGSRVLLIEDEPINQMISQAFLESIGLQVSLANHGREALGLLASQTFDLIITDMQMPVMDGLETAREIRKMPAFAAVPILAMTANAFSDDRAACMAVGMNDFIPKPFVPDDLYRIVLKWLSVHQAARKERGSELSAEPS